MLKPCLSSISSSAEGVKSDILVKQRAYLFLESIAIKSIVEVNKSQKVAKRCQHTLTDMVSAMTEDVRLEIPGFFFLQVTSGTV